MRRTLLVSSGLLLAIAGVVGGVGVRQLPESSKVARSARYYGGTSKEIWGAVTDIAAWPAWRTEMTALERLDDIRGHAVWRETTGGETLTWETVETLPDRRLTQCVADAAGPYGGCRTWEMVVRDDGAILSIIESIRIKSRTFRLLNSAGGRASRLDDTLDALGKKFGETPPKRDVVRELSLLDREKKEAEKAAADAAAARTGAPGTAPVPPPAPAPAPVPAPAQPAAVPAVPTSGVPAPSQGVP